MRVAQIMVRLDPEMADQLKAYALSSERTVSQVVRLAIKRFLAADLDKQ